MDIDLEHPSQQEEKLDTVSDTSVLEIDEEENIESPTHGPVIGNSAGDEIENILMRDQEIQDHSWDSINEPRCGLEFESKEAAYSFYREYARMVGFGITIKASRRSKKSGNFIDVKISCSRFGNERKSSAKANSRSCPKTDCRASMHMKKRHDGVWFIYSFVKEHNHEICPDDFYYAIRGRNKQSGVIPNQKKGLQLSLDEEDVQLLFEHFMTSQGENPSFFYAIDLDQEKRLRNVFWVDAKGRNDYKFFSDVVFFDMYYVKQKHKIPFAPIIGVNHHFQYILLGCALIGDESISSFIWLMRTWLRAMSGQAPTVVITDEDKALMEATKEVLPEARHCFCLWHVLSKISENYGLAITTFENFSTEFRKCVLQCWTEDEFENRWWKMVDKFELCEDEWIQSLFEDRKKWVPTFMRNFSLAGLSTAQRCESVFSFFDKHMNTESAFKEFIDHYKIYLHGRYVEEAKADFETLNRQPILRTLSPFEKQMSMVYTHAVFKEFQIEVSETSACSILKEDQRETTVIFLIYDCEGTQKFYVSWDEAESSIFCSCHLFVYKGFLCRHALMVLQFSGISNIPSKYILKRWTKDAKVKQIVDKNCKRLHYRVERFNDLCKLAAKLGEEGAVSQESYNIACNALEETLKHCVDVNSSVRSTSESHLRNHGLLGLDEENLGTFIGKTSKRRKAQKNQKEVNARTGSFDMSYVHQQGMQAMGLSSRTSNLDVYIRAQQTAEEEEQLNSIPSTQDVCYTNQQGMYGLGQLNTIPSHVHQFSLHQTQALGQVSFKTPAAHGNSSIHDSQHDMEDTVNIASKCLQDNHTPR